MRRHRTLRDELLRALRELADHAHASHRIARPAGAAGRALLFARLARRPAWCEWVATLSRVHSREQAALLREAAELRLCSSAEARLYTAAPETPRFEDWLRRCAAAIERALESRVGLSGDLLACVLVEPDAWPPALELAAAAQGVLRGEEGRLLLARARYADGRRARAESCYRAIVHGARRPLVLAGAREALGVACERRGAHAEALEQLERAAAQGAGLRAEVAGLGLALALGREQLAGQAAERVEARGDVGPWAARWAREVRARWELAGSSALLQAGAARARTLLRGARGPLADALVELFPTAPGGAA
jgi:hypothetical protein